MEFSLLWTLASILNVWKAHGTLPIPVVHLENNIIEDDDTTITCTLPYNDYQDAELVIKMDNVSLTNCNHRKGSYPNVSCTIEVTRDMHEKEVTCEAQFKSLSKPTNMMLRTEPKFTVCPEKLVWIEGQRNRFHCKATGYPLPNVTCETKGRIYKEGETLTAAKNMSGNYTCKAKNEDLVTKIVTVSVEYKPKIVNFNVSPALRDIGDEVMLNCEANGLPDPTYSWKVPSSNVKFSSDNRTITVQSLQNSQLGRYTCTAQNQHGTDSMEHVLDLAVKPKVVQIKVQPYATVEEGTNVTLTCVTEGHPPPTISWTLPTTNVQYSSDKKVINIWGANKAHDGNYQCKAENNHGEDTQTTKVSVKASSGSRGERREPIFATILATLILFYYLC